MTWVTDLQKFFPWASGLPLLPKLVLSVIIVLVVALGLLFIWATPQPNRTVQASPDAGPVPHDTAPKAPNLPLKARWEGIWESTKGYRFSFVMHLNIAGDDTVDGYILWRLLHTPPGSLLAHRVNEPGTEFVRGSINRQTGEVALAGYKVDNPTLLALDRYRFFISSDGRTFRGVSQNTDGTWQTAINGVFSIVNE